MNKKSSWIMVVIFMFGIVSIVCGCIFYQNQKLAKEKGNLENNLNKYIDENKNLKNDIENSNEKLNSYKNKTCEYTQTFFYLGDYKYTANVPKHKFIIVDRSQEFSPQILEINMEEFDLNFKYNHNYEITFTESINKSSHDKPIIKEIKETDKVGLDQIQETCKFIED